jgi:ATP-binding cassette, subfamily B, bacterial MsbA
MRFYVPEATDFTDSNSQLDATSLRIIAVKKGGMAYMAGIRMDDRISNINQDSNDTQLGKITRTELLEKLATAKYNSQITVHVMTAGKLGNKQVLLNTGSSAGMEKRGADVLQWVAGFLPRGQASASKERAVVLIIGLMIIVTIIRCGATFYQKYMADKITHVAIAHLREDAFAHVMTIPVGFFSKEGTSDTVSRLMGDISGTGAGIQILMGKALREPLNALFCVFCAMYFSWKLTLIFLACAPFTMGLGVVLGKKIKKYTKRSLANSALMLGRLEGVISALPVVKVYNRQKHEHSVYQQINQRFLKQVLRAAKADAASGPAMEILGMIAGSAALLVGTRWITRNQMDPTSFFALLLFLGTAAESMRKTNDVWNNIHRANAAAERVFAVIDLPTEMEKPDAIELPTFRDKIEFCNVVFSYNKEEQRPVLKGINLTVKSNCNIAVVGPNGSGKTTLVNLIPRFYDVDSGAVLIDGQDVRDCTLSSLRNQIGLVTQNVVTFNDTIAANIGYGKKDATIDEIVTAAKRSFAHEFIEPLPDGYNTLIGEHGAGLSGGQLQRIIIARAILKNPPILIFDEATSQVDADSEAKIHRALSELMHNRTCFIIAHRFSTVISANIIVVMNHGQIVAQGQHEELIKSCTLYQSLYETQLIKQQ